MSFEKNYPEIRRGAVDLMYALSKALNRYNRRMVLNNPDVFLQYTHVMAWLGAVVCDDWWDINEIAEEFQLMEMPINLPGRHYAEVIFEKLLKDISIECNKHIERKVKKNKIILLSRSEYISLGWENGFLKVVKPYLGKSQLVIDESGR